MKAEAEIERLEQNLKESHIDIREHLAEIERLTIRLRKAEHQFDDAMKMYNTIKAEAYKEAFEKVKEISPLRFNVEYTEYYDKPSVDKMVLFIDDNDLDNLLKELVGE